MKTKVVLTFGILALVAVVTVNINIAKSNSAETLFLNNVEKALGFEFNGQEWDTDSHWYNKGGGDWKPVYGPCKGSRSDGTGTITWDGHWVQCQGGDGNCVDGTGCLVDAENPPS
jgi:hypothetical protein